MSRPDLNEIISELTDRQRTCLETAVYSGYFEWPRDASAEDVAKSIGVSPPTFHEHLRKAQKDVFSSLYSSPATITE
ncbi:helix-turn-helix domain-containing protein [Halovenus amylolytica]|uniref:helix-turn-helix domain-containing protein n=1 Tax=Halovenus amylolytica TaxID=2500550 RepID=UPI003D6BC7E6